MGRGGGPSLTIATGKEFTDEGKTGERLKKVTSGHGAPSTSRLKVALRSALEQIRRSSWVSSALSFPPFSRLVMSFRKLWRSRTTARS